MEVLPEPVELLARISYQLQARTDKIALAGSTLIPATPAYIGWSDEPFSLPPPEPIRHPFISVTALVAFSGDKK